MILVLAYYNCPMLCTQVLNGLVSSVKRSLLRRRQRVRGRHRELRSARAAGRRAGEEKLPTSPNTGGRAPSAGWHFLTGSLASIERLTQAVGFRYRYDDSQGQFAHASAIYVATPDGRLSRYFYGIEYAPRDLRLALIEASGGRIGSPVDQILLYCYHYDPKVGKYSAVVMSIVRLGGVAAVLVLSTFLILMWRRDRRRDAAKLAEALRSRNLSPTRKAI